MRLQGYGKSTMGYDKVTDNYYHWQWFHGQGAFAELAQRLWDIDYPAHPIGSNLCAYTSYDSIREYFQSFWPTLSISVASKMAIRSRKRLS